MKPTTYLLIFGAMLLLLMPPVFSQNLPAGFVAVEVVGGLDPVAMALAPDGRIFIAEKFGRVVIVEDGVLQLQPFLEVETEIDYERGMSGIALDPDFENNPFVYVYYTVKGKNHNRVSRFKADGNFAIWGSEEILLDLDSLSGPFHNAGALGFGPDGKLYISTGDGISSHNAPWTGSTLGKVLRINPDGTIPSDNPFYEEATGKNRAIWAVGFRNPFSMAIDQVSGRVFVGDVGSDQYEELNEVTKGSNYGWPAIEGKLTTQVPPANYVDPIFAFNHVQGCAVSGVTRYLPTIQQFPPAYYGKMFVLEHCQGKLFVVDPETGENELFGTGLPSCVNLLTAPDGSIYLLDRYGTSSNYVTTNGILRRIIYTGSQAPYITNNPKSVVVPEGEAVDFQVKAAGLGPFHYKWLKNELEIPNTNSPTLEVANPSLADSASLFRCIVTNLLGADTSDAALLGVTTNKRPTIDLISPPEGSFYQGGGLIHLLAEAFDQEDGILHPSAFKWRVDFNHLSHTHPAFGPVGNTDDEIFAVPAVTEVSDSVWYTVVVTATDSKGLATTVVREIRPEKSDIQFKTEPAGFPCYVDGHFYQSPALVKSVVGVYHNLTAPKSHYWNGWVYLFEQWSDGVTENVRFEAPGENGLKLTAIYRKSVQLGTGTGLNASYYDMASQVNEFVEPPVFSRIDTTINFLWEGGSPDTAKLGIDWYMIKWEGALMPLFDEWLKFSINMHSDAVRLWVNDELVIDRWYPSVVFEESGSIYLKGGVKYAIRLEYAENDWVANCQLFWSSESLAKGVVPKRQLFPETVLPRKVFDQFRFLVLPNPFEEFVKLDVESPEDGRIVAIELFDIQGRIVKSQSFTLQTGRWELEMDTRDLPNGLFFMRIKSGETNELVKVVKQ